MADDWEEEDFEVPDFTAKVASIPGPKTDEEEEDESSNNVTTKAASATSTKQTEAALKKAKEEEIKLANKLKFAQLDSLTPEQRKLREREMVEEADVRLAGELFGGSVQSGTEDDISRGFGSIPIKTKQDHINFAILCAGKMEESTPFNVLAFYKEITDSFKSKLTLEGLEEIIKILTAAKDEKKRTAATTNKTVKKSKAQMKEEKRRHDDIFGGTDDYGAESRYDEDDFM